MIDFDANETRNTSEAIRYCLVRLQKYGIELLASAAFLAMILKGMPWHNLWPASGTLTLLVTAFFFAKTVQFGGTALASWWLRRAFIRQSEELCRPLAPKPSHRGKLRMKK
jgi:hypothetical protein